MRPEEGKQAILDSLAIGRADVAAAKAFLTKAAESDTARLIDRWIASNGADCPQPVLLRGESADEDLRRAARWLSLRLAASYAVWELIGAGYLTPAGTMDEERPSIQYTTVMPGSGGVSASWPFPELTFSYPVRIYRPIEAAQRGVFTDGDLYLQELGLEDLHPGIQEALREAVRCFRYDLFTGTVAMLGAASEGLWIELGRALVNACPDSSRSQRITKELSRSQHGTGYLVKQIAEMCENEARTILKQANVAPATLRSAVLWWDTVREARNVLHWEVEPTFANSYDKVSVLMLSAASHLRTLWTIRITAQNAKP